MIQRIAFVSSLLCLTAAGPVLARPAKPLGAVLTWRFHPPVGSRFLEQVSLQYAQTTSLVTDTVVPGAAPAATPAPTPDPNINPILAPTAAPAAPTVGAPATVESTDEKTASSEGMLAVDLDIVSRTASGSYLVRCTYRDIKFRFRAAVDAAADAGDNGRTSRSATSQSALQPYIDRALASFVNTRLEAVVSPTGVVSDIRGLPALRRRLARVQAYLPELDELNGGGPALSGLVGVSDPAALFVPQHRLPVHAVRAGIWYASTEVSPHLAGGVGSHLLTGLRGVRGGLEAWSQDGELYGLKHPLSRRFSAPSGRTMAALYVDQPTGLVVQLDADVQLQADLNLAGRSDATSSTGGAVAIHQARHVTLTREPLERTGG